MAEVRGRYGVQIFDGRWLRVDATARTLWPAGTEVAERFYVVIAEGGELCLLAESVQGWVRVGSDGLLRADASEAGATRFTNSMLAASGQPSFNFGLLAPGGRSLRVGGSGPLTTVVGEAEASSVVRFTSERLLGGAAAQPGSRVTPAVDLNQRPVLQVERPSLSTGAEQKLKRPRSG